MSESTYMIGTGWWCGGQAGDGQRPLVKGDSLIRGVSFHRLWENAISKYSNPTGVVIVDSASPIPPPPTSLSCPVQHIRLDHNALHASIHTGKYAGWTRSVLLGLAYTNLCKADYFVYVEQDALIYGQGIVERAIASMRFPYLFGHPGVTPQPLQQSFFVIRRDGFEPFLRRYSQLRARDGQVSPECKFALSTSRVARLFPEFLFRQRFPGARILSRTLGRYDLLPFGFGRSRPIDFSLSHFYFQHGSLSELEEYCRVTRLAFPGSDR